MRQTPQIERLRWLVERPIAHRGLHNQAKGVIENCATAFAAAIARSFAIECDIELTKDGEAVVFHDDDVDRLLDAKGPVKSFTLEELRRLKFRHGNDTVQTLQEFLQQVSGRVPLVIEIKSLWDGDFTLTDRAVSILQSYKGPHALMSFDPELVARVAATSEDTIRGITADNVSDPYYDPLPQAKRQAMKDYSHLPQTRPHFISFDFSQLPFAPVTTFRHAGHPVITWTIRSEQDRQLALRYSDQVTFENFLPS